MLLKLFAISGGSMILCPSTTRLDGVCLLSFGPQSSKAIYYYVIFYDKNELSTHEL